MDAGVLNALVLEVEQVRVVGVRVHGGPCRGRHSLEGGEEEGASMARNKHYLTFEENYGV